MKRLLGGFSHAHGLSPDFKPSMSLKEALLMQTPSRYQAGDGAIWQQGQETGTLQVLYEAAQQFTRALLSCGIICQGYLHADYVIKTGE